MSIPSMDFKYNKQAAIGDTWKRASSIIIYNDYGQVPRVMFAEEQIVEVDGGIFRRPAGELMMVIDNSNLFEEFEVLNPDGTPSGQIASVAQLAALLTSSYVHFADKRDEEVRRLQELLEQEEPPVEPEPTPETDPVTEEPVVEEPVTDPAPVDDSGSSETI